MHGFIGMMKWLVNIYKLSLGTAVVITLALCLCFMGNDFAIADNVSGNLLKQTPTNITVSLGNTAGELKFFPKNLEFTTGKRYKLQLTNPSPQKHYFTAKDFADAIWTQKVEAGNVEVKGAIHELELKPQAEADWVFVPIKPGNYQLRCSIAGHTQAGMIGKITVVNQK